MTLWDSQAYIVEARATGINPNIVTAALGHANAIRSVSRDLPIIFTLSHLAQACGVAHSYLMDVADRRIDPYRDYITKKREKPHRTAFSRRYRIICMPDPELKKVQRWVHQNILSKVTPHRASTAYSNSNTLLDAAARHTNARWLIKIDIERFFESIKEPYVAGIFERLGYPDLLSFQLARLCTRLPSLKSRKDIFCRRSKPVKGVMQNDWIGFLPQGAPTSPQLANLVMRRFDRRMTSLSRTEGLRYSRYSDDMIFSTLGSFSRPQATSFVHQVYDVLGAYGFEANRTKTSIAAPGARKVVLGLLVDRDEPRLTREFRSNIETHLHYLERPNVGPVAHAKAREFDSIIGLQNHLLGLIAFARQIDRKYGDELRARLHRINWPA
ncbi:reverse transcriptase family protein [Gluconobacter oxydans]|uniref:reverse transcriptase family protein n=1 Tax=Gluconobacter oxydans TaxID=442 RepID=UPI000699F2E8|nr:reverse transcriptase family protein [Gluconobacter oxydans]